MEDEGRPFGVVDGVVAAATAAVYCAVLYAWPHYLAGAAGPKCTAAGGMWFAGKLAWWFPFLGAPVGLIAAGFIQLFRRETPPGHRDALLFLGLGALLSVPLAGLIPWAWTSVGYCVGSGDIYSATLHGDTARVPFSSLNGVSLRTGRSVSVLLQQADPHRRGSKVTVMQVDLDAVADPRALQTEIMKRADAAGMSDPGPLRPPWQ